MNHRIVSAVVVTIVALFALAAGMFTWALATATPQQNLKAFAADNPHPPSRRTAECPECHTVEKGTIPVTHRNYDRDSCASCHRLAVPVLVPHSIAMGDVRCPLCHGDPGRDSGVPVSHLRYETDECLLCHPVDAEHFDVEPAPAGLARSYAAPIPHETGGLFEDCTYCHQIGQRRSLPANHRDFALETCEDCHEPSDGAPGN